jgi:hypothetical protein
MSKVLRSMVVAAAVLGSVSGSASAAVAAAGPAGSAEPAGPVTTAVGGSWLQWANCVFVSFDPKTGDFRCVGGSTWEGTWTGITHYDVTGNLNLETGDMRGAFTETFTGTSLPDKAAGSLVFREAFTIEGATQVLHIESDIVGGDGDAAFRCSSGHVTFDGVDPVVTGVGGYRGTWTHGCR